MANKVISDPKELVRLGLITDRSIASSILAGQMDLAKACKYITMRHSYIFDFNPAVDAAPAAEPVVDAAPVAEPAAPTIETIVITIDGVSGEFAATDNAQACVRKLGFNPSKLYSNGALYTITKKATVDTLKDVVLTAVAPAAE